MSSAHSIDVSMIITTDDELERSGRMRELLENEPVNVYILDNRTMKLGVPAARKMCFGLGKSTFVTHVDPDDEIIPGIFHKILAVLEKYPNTSCIGVNEILRTDRGDHFVSMLSSMSFLDRLHHLTLLRRELASPSDGYPTNMAGTGLEEVAKYLLAYPELIYLDFAGYIWDQRGDASFSRTAADCAPLASLDGKLLYRGVDLTRISRDEFVGNTLRGHGYEYLVQEPRSGSRPASVLSAR